MAQSRKLFSRKPLYLKKLHISLYSVQMQENTDQKNSEYRHFSHTVIDKNPCLM